MGKKVKIRCITTNRIYESIRLASKETGINASLIARVLNGQSNQTHGLKWEYVDKRRRKKALAIREQLKNSRTGKRARLEHNGHKRDRKVLCIENNKEYSSVKEAAKDYGVKPIAIYNACNGNSHSSCGYHWKYI